MSSPLEPILVDLSGKHIVITGATDGIGKEAARGLLKLGATAMLVGRNEIKLQAVREGFIAEGIPATRVDYAVCDLSLVQQVHRLADEIEERWPRVDVLLNNAGCYPDRHRITADGFEEAWATNVLAYEVLTTRLADRISASQGRVVIVASTKAGKLDLEDLAFSRRRFSGIAAYEQSKQANRMLAWAWQRRFAHRALTINVAHPGGVATNIAHRQRGLWGLLTRLLFKTQRTPELGADTLVWLAACPELVGKTGGFYKDRQEIPCAYRDDVARGEALWERCQKQISRTY